MADWNLFPPGAVGGTADASLFILFSFLFLF
jgi:hypothetical protein